MADPAPSAVRKVRRDGVADRECMVLFLVPHGFEAFQLDAEYLRLDWLSCRT